MRPSLSLPLMFVYDWGSTVLVRAWAEPPHFVLAIDSFTARIKRCNTNPRV